MIFTILFFLSGFGLTNIIVREKIFERPRKFIEKYFPYSMVNKIIHCESCCSVWVGFMLFWMIPAISPYILLNVLIAGLSLNSFVRILATALYKF